MSKKIGRPRTGKSSNPDFSVLSVYIPSSLHRAVKARLIAEDGGEMSELVAKLLFDWNAAQPAAPAQPQDERAIHIHITR
jgi:hypothetical protein